MFFFISLFRNSFRIKTDVSALTEYGRKLIFLHKNVSSFYFSFGFPQSGGLFVPQGTTLVSEGEITENDALKWEGTLSTKNNFYFFAPSIVLNIPFIKTLVSSDLPDIELSDYSYLNMTILNRNIEIDLNLFTKHENERKFDSRWTRTKEEEPTFAYRTFSGDIYGVSNTFLKSKKTQNISIFEPFPSFCKPDISKISGTCSIKRIRRGFKGYNIKLEIKEESNCSYSYPYRCSFLRWNAFGQNPDKGFLVGPNVIKENGRTSFSNIAWIHLPTPDFSMIFNTPIIVGCFISSVFAIGVRHISKKEENKK